MTDNITIKKISPDHPSVQNLICQLDEYQEDLYPSESNHLDSVETLKKPNVRFIGAFLNKELAGIGAVKTFRDYGEIKRMFVSSTYRGKGVAKIILKDIENFLTQQGIFFVRLETGILQKEAISLYKSHGFKECSPFGKYTPDPLSLFMEKELNNSNS
ncbi:MAG: GNAT family N-acetyltransferase [Desulfobacteraceae bacterium]|nr:GNAT family N-acetyltransferase [Desulfobacteraceae bacterium]